jgi:hypothetical protein
VVQGATNAGTAALRRNDQAAQETDRRRWGLREHSAQAIGFRHALNRIVDGQSSGADDLIVRDGDPVPRNPVVWIEQVVQREFNGHLGTPASLAQGEDCRESSLLGRWIEFAYRREHLGPRLIRIRYSLSPN